MPKKRVLIVGEDQALNEAREGLLVSRFIVSSGKTDEAVAHFDKSSAEVMLICHTVPLLKAADLIRVVTHKRPATKVVWLSEWQTPAELARVRHKVVSIDYRNQPWIQELNKTISDLNDARFPVLSQDTGIRIVNGLCEAQQESEGEHEPAGDSMRYRALLLSFPAPSS